MATKKRVKRKTTHGKKRRRVSGNPPVISGIGKRRRRRKKAIGEITGSTVGDTLLGAATGAIVAVVINKAIPGNDKMKAIGEMVVGAGAAVYGAKKKKPFIAGIGAGMGIVGALGVGRSFGFIDGMDEIMSGIGFTEEIQGVGAGKEDTMLIEINGTGEDLERIVNGDNPPVVSGEAFDPSAQMTGNPAVLS